MPSKKKKYNARFPPARIKKIMQSDEDVGKVAQAVPVIISRALELFVESLLKKAEVVTQSRNAKTLTPSHLKQCIMSEQRFDFLRDLVSAVSDVQGDEDTPDPNTPRPGGSAGDVAFTFQSQNQGPSTSSSATAAAVSASVAVDHQQSSEPYMMSLQNPLQQHYIKKDEIITTKTEQNYAPPTSATPAGSAMTRSHQYASVITAPHHPQQPPGLGNNSPYIPTAAGLHLQQQAQPHFYYGQYDSSSTSNGSVKVESVVQTNELNRHYSSGSDHSGQHGGYDYSAEPQPHHY